MLCYEARQLPNYKKWPRSPEVKGVPEVHLRVTLLNIQQLNSQVAQLDPTTTGPREDVGRFSATQLQVALEETFVGPTGLNHAQGSRCNFQLLGTLLPRATLSRRPKAVDDV